jgi:hypothetical protein
MHADRQHLRYWFKAGHWVEVRSKEEILATLDSEGRLEGMPFMPEMLQYCGRRFRIFKRADKTCDPARQPWTIRRLKDSVHLEGLRCDGSGHGGCEAGCLLFWKEAWLKPVSVTDFVTTDKLESPPRVGTQPRDVCRVEDILSAACKINAADKSVYMCQATDVPKFTSPMRWWDLRQYVRDVRSGNLAGGMAGESRRMRFLETLLAIHMVVRPLLIGSFNWFAERFGSKVTYPPPLRTPQRKTPSEVLNLEPGELVQVRSKEEILATLDENSKNRGMYFGPEMLHYSGGIYRVLRRVNHIVDENTGEMLHMKSPCIILEGVWCQSSYYHRYCPRAIYAYWREIWLKRVDLALPAPAAQDYETCQKC